MFPSILITACDSKGNDQHNPERTPPATATATAAPTENPCEKARNSAPNGLAETVLTYTGNSTQPYSIAARVNGRDAEARTVITITALTTSYISWKWSNGLNPQGGRSYFIAPGNVRRDEPVTKAQSEVRTKNQSEGRKKGGRAERLLPTPSATAADP